MPALPVVIDEEAGLVTRFAALLRCEQAELKAGNASVLPELTQQKSALIDEINAAANRRNLLLAEAGFALDKTGMAAWLNEHPGERKMRQTWEKMLVVARDIQELNRLNGQLLSIHLSATQEALATLTEQARRSTLYGPNGQTAPLTGHRIIDSA